MKDIIKNVFTTLIILALTGCTFSRENATTTIHTTAPYSAADSTDTNSAAQICRPNPMARSLEEYEAYLNRFDALPPEFIHFNALKEYGSFVNFVDASDWQTYRYYSDDRIDGVCNIYSYCLMDPVGFKTFVYITPLAEYNDHFNEAKELTTYECLHINTDENGYYRHNDVYYEYYNGELAQIILTAGNVAISVKPYEDDAKFSNYPVNTATLISALFNTETATAAVAELNAKIAAARQNAEVKGAQ